MKTASTALVNYLSSLSSNPVDWGGFAVDLYTITLVSGTIIRFCSASAPVTIGGNTFAVLSPATPNVPVVNRFQSSANIGLSESKAIVKINALPTVHVNGMPWLQAMALGFFDGAEVLIERCIMPTAGDISLGKYIEFVGTIGDITNLDRTSATFDVQGLTELLNVNMPRNLYQPGCRHSLFDSGCTLLKSSYQINGIVGAGATVITIPTNLTQPGPGTAPVAAPSMNYVSVSGVNYVPLTYYAVVTYVTALGETTASPEAVISVPSNHVPQVLSPPGGAGILGWNAYASLSSGNEQLQTDSPLPIGTNWAMNANGLRQGPPPPEISTNGWFSQGVLTFTSGVNAGLSYVIAQYLAGGTLQLVIGTLAAPANGDTFTIVPGCDKQLTTCRNKFANTPNFAGVPFIPVPETAA